MVWVDVPVVQFSVPHAVSRLVQDVFLLLVDPPERAEVHVIRPPALKKYRAASALANVMVCVAVNDVDQLVLRVATPLVVIVLPTAAALLRLVKHELKLVLKLDLTAIVSPALGPVIAVTLVPVCAAIEVKRLNIVDHCVAVIVDPALTGESVVPCPQPLSNVPVPHMVLILATLLSPVPAALPVAKML